MHGFLQSKVLGVHTYVQDKASMLMLPLLRTYVHVCACMVAMQIAVIQSESTIIIYQRYTTEFLQSLFTIMYTVRLIAMVIILYTY